jgi:O-antigen ligase
MTAVLGRTLSYLKFPSAGGIRAVSIWLSLFFVFSIPWENAIQIGHIGRASKALGYLTVIVWGLGVLANKRLRKPDSLQQAYLLFLIWNGLTLYWSLDPAATVDAFVTYLETFGLLLLFWDLYDRELLVKAALQAYVIGAFVAAGSVIVNYLTAPPVRFAEHERISALGYKTDGIALVVAVAAPAAWYLAAHPGARERPVSARALNYAYIPVAVLAVAMTGTRGASIAGIPTALFILWSLRSVTLRTRVAALGAAVIAGVALVQFAPSGQLDRIATVSDLGEQTPQGALGGRAEIWRDSAQVFVEHPIAGVGTDAHRAAVAPRLEQRSAYKKAEKEAHNTYVSVLTETGVVGFLLFAFIIGCVLRCLRQHSNWERWFWSVQMSVLAIGAMTLSLEDSKSLWLMTALTVASAAAARTGEARLPDVPRGGRRPAAALRPSPILRFD